MPITFVGSEQIDSAAAAVPSLTVTVPAGTQQGDRMTLVAQLDDGPVGEVVRPEGWEFIARRVVSGSPGSFPLQFIYQRLARGVPGSKTDDVDGEPSSYTVEFDAGTQGLSIAITTRRGAGPILTPGTNAAAPPVSPSQTTTLANELLVCIYQQDGATQGTPNPAGMTGRWLGLTTGSGNGAHCGESDELIVAAGATGTRSWITGSGASASGDSWRMQPAAQILSVVGARTHWLRVGETATLTGAVLDAGGGHVVELGDGPNHGTATLALQTVTNETATEIEFTVDPGALAEGPLYVFVTAPSEAASDGFRTYVLSAGPDVEVELLRVTGPSVASTVQFVGTKRPSELPKFARLISAGMLSSEEPDAATSRNMIGVYDGTTQAVIAAQLRNAVGTSIVRRLFSTTQIGLIFSSSSTGNTTEELQATQFVAGGIEIQWTLASNNPREFMLALYFGTGLEAAVTVSTLPQGGTGDELLVNVGFDPEHLEVWHCGFPADQPVEPNSMVGLGLVSMLGPPGSIAKQHCHDHNMNDAVATMQQIAILRTDAAAVQVFGTVESWRQRIEVAQADENIGYRWKFDVGDPIGDDVITVAFRFGGLQHHLTTLIVPSAAGNYENNAPGFKPQFQFGVLSKVTATDTLFQDAQAEAHSWCAFDDTNEDSMGMWADDGVGTAACRTMGETVAQRMIDGVATINVRALFVQFLSDGWELNLTNFSGSMRHFMTFALEELPPTFADARGVASANGQADAVAIGLAAAAGAAQSEGSAVAVRLLVALAHGQALAAGDAQALEVLEAFAHGSANAAGLAVAIHTAAAAARGLALASGRAVPIGIDTPIARGAAVTFGAAATAAIRQALASGEAVAAGDAIAAYIALANAAGDAQSEGQAVAAIITDAIASGEAAALGRALETLRVLTPDAAGASVAQGSAIAVRPPIGELFADFIAPEILADWIRTGIVTDELRAILLRYQN